MLRWMKGRPNQQNVTVMLRKARDGEAVANEELYDYVFTHLHDIAKGLMRSERLDHSLQTTALVSEVWLRLGGADIDWQDRAHFYRVAARVMRRALVDHARARRTAKRDSGGERDSLDALVDAWGEMDYDLLDLNDALEALADSDETLARIVELRFFAGLTLEQVGETVGMPFQKVHRSWSFARSWLHDRMTTDGDSE